MQFDRPFHLKCMKCSNMKRQSFYLEVFELIDHTRSNPYLSLNFYQTYLFLHIIKKQLLQLNMENCAERVMKFKNIRSNITLQTYLKNKNASSGLKWNGVKGAASYTARHTRFVLLHSHECSLCQPLLHACKYDIHHN